ncbi:MAG: DUF481 domain-containing protein [Pseudomonadales bacterium]|nr:DUF481 domain-containing protein [Pseudomonadales bacterium]
MKFGYSVAVGFLMCCNLVFADTLHLKNGDRISGSLKSISEGKVLFETEYAGSLVLALDVVSGINTDKIFDIKLESKQTISGKLVWNDSGMSVLSGLGVEKKSTAVDLASLVNANEDLQTHTNFERIWANRVDVNASLSTGNSDSFVMGLAAQSSLKKNTSQHDASIRWDREESNSVKIKDQLDVDYGYKHFMNKKWFLSGNSEYFSDPIKDVDRRVTVGAGMGYQFWDNSLGAFSADLGGSEVFEKLDSKSENNPAVRWSLGYNRYFLGQRIEAFHNHQILKILGSGRGAVLSAVTGLRYALNAHLDTLVQIDLQHETEPAIGQKKTDLTYKLGVGYKF